MPPDFDTRHDTPESALGDALRALPVLAPERDLWQQLQRELPVRKSARPRSWPVWLSAAAALVLAVLLWPARLPQPTTEAVAESDPRQPWIAESQALESTLRALESEPLDAGMALAGAELEDLIGLTDLQLSVADDREDQLALWQQRVALMSELAELRSQGRSRIAADNADMMPAAYRMN